MRLLGKEQDEAGDGRTTAGGPTSYHSNLVVPKDLEPAAMGPLLLSATGTMLTIA